MRLATVSANGERLYGAIVDDGFVALSPDFPTWPTLRHVLEDDGLSVLADASSRRSVTHRNGRFAYQIPIPSPEKIICVGVNYPARNEEYRDGQDAPKNMSLFVRFPRSFVGHNMPLIRPKASDQLDYEGEIAVVIGKTGRRIPDPRPSVTSLV